MIPPARWPAFARWFGGVAGRRVRRRFAAIHLRGVERLRPGPESVLVVSNHLGYWDGLVAAWLGNRVVGAEAYALMRTEELRRFSMFTRAGAIGVDPLDALDGARVLRMLGPFLRAKPRLLWVFAQGEERPGRRRPLRFHAGASLLARRGQPLRVLPVAIDYLFAGHPDPELYLSVGEGLPLGATPRQQADAVERELDRISACAEDAALRAANFASSGRAHEGPRPGLPTRVLGALVAPRPAREGTRGSSAA